MWNFPQHYCCTVTAQQRCWGKCGVFLNSTFKCVALTWMYDTDCQALCKENQSQRSVCSTERVGTYGQTDGHDRSHYLSQFPNNAVISKTKRGAFRGFGDHKPGAQSSWHSLTATPGGHRQRPVTGSQVLPSRHEQMLLHPAPYVPCAHGSR